jgi:hypothetical protein
MSPVSLALHVISLAYSHALSYIERVRRLGISTSNTGPAWSNVVSDQWPLLATWKRDPPSLRRVRPLRNVRGPCIPQKLVRVRQAFLRLRQRYRRTPQLCNTESQARRAA